MTKKNAIIMAAGTSSRFVPLSAELPKGLINVKGEILIERQIRQLQEAGIDDIVIVVGYKAELFAYLKDKYSVEIVLNNDYARYNNTSSLIRVIDKLDNTFVCSSDNYFPENVFFKEAFESYYSALYAKGRTEEYCLTVDSNDYISNVHVGGSDAWYMVGHVFFAHEFSEAFSRIMIKEYENEDTKHGYWEDVFIRNINQLPLMKINRYKEGEILEFDSLDELRMFDKSYCENTRSSVIKQISKQFGVMEADIHSFKNIKHQGDYLLFQFRIGESRYEYNAENKEVEIKQL